MEDRQKLEKELETGIESLKRLVERGASQNMITFQGKIIHGTLEDLLINICGSSKKEDSNKFLDLLKDDENG
jgi:hypothetical protein